MKMQQSEQEHEQWRSSHKGMTVEDLAREARARSRS